MYIEIGEPLASELQVLADHFSLGTPAGAVQHALRLLIVLRDAERLNADVALISETNEVTRLNVHGSLTESLEPAPGTTPAATPGK